jgi:hypothetical protein
MFQFALIIRKLQIRQHPSSMQHLHFAENESVSSVNRANKRQKQRQNSKHEYSINQKYIAGSSKSPSWSSATSGKLYLFCVFFDSLLMVYKKLIYVSCFVDY